MLQGDNNLYTVEHVNVPYETFYCLQIRVHFVTRLSFFVLYLL